MGRVRNKPPYVEVGSTCIVIRKFAYRIPNTFPIVPALAEVGDLVTVIATILEEGEGKVELLFLTTGQVGALRFKQLNACLNLF